MSLNKKQKEPSAAVALRYGRMYKAYFFEDEPVSKPIGVTVITTSFEKALDQIRRAFPERMLSCLNGADTMDTIEDYTALIIDSALPREAPEDPDRDMHGIPKEFSRSHRSLGYEIQSLKDSMADPKVMIAPEKIPVDLGRAVNALVAFVRLTLLFHSGSPWDERKQAEWHRQQSLIFLWDQYDDGDLRRAQDETTTKHLCDLGRLLVPEMPAGEEGNDEA